MKRIGFHFFQPDFVQPGAVCVMCKESQGSGRHIAAKALNEEALCHRR